MGIGKYMTAQVCLSGHSITSSIYTWPEDMEKYCSKCSECTITACPECGETIRGFKTTDVWSRPNIRGYKPPAYCHKCAAPFPWTSAKIAAAIEVFAEFGNLNDTEKQTIENDIENIAKDTPRAELSARHIKRIWERVGIVGYDAIMELSSRTIAQILK